MCVGRPGRRPGQIPQSRYGIWPGHARTRQDVGQDKTAVCRVQCCRHYAADVVETDFQLIAYTIARVWARTENPGNMYCTVD
eukprot:353647-Chlamydomonas_euryale.AAC.3